MAHNRRSFVGMQNAAAALAVPPAEEERPADGKVPHLENTYIMGPRPHERSLHFPFRALFATMQYRVIVDHKPSV